MLPLQIALVFLLLASGAMLAGALALSRGARLELEHHVNLIALSPQGSTAAIVSASSAGRLSWIDEPVRGLFCIGVRSRWGMRSRALVLLAVAAVPAAVTWLLGYRMLGNSTWLASLLSVLAFFSAPRWLLSREQKRAERQFMELFPNAIDMMIRMLKAGLPIISAARSIGTESPPPINTVFELIASQVDIGVPFEKALDLVSQRVGLPDFRFFSVAVTLQHTTGGNLAATLELLSDVIRKRRAMRLKAVAATAEVRVSAYVVGGMPIAVIGILFLLKPDYVAPLLYDLRGKYILAAAGSLLVLGFWTMRRMMGRVTAI